MGSEDYMFLESIKHVTKEHKNSKLIIVEDSGHVVNVDKPKEFNISSIKFLKKIIKKK